MSKSLQEQLLKAGLGNAKTAKNINKQKHKERVQAGKKGTVVNEASVLAEQARQQQQARDQELNRQRKAEQDQKAILAQVKQLIELNSIQAKGDLAYNFTDGSLVKRLYINAKVQSELGKGQIAIARLADSYHLIPVKVAEKIQQRLASAIIVLNNSQQSAEVLAEDDPYAAYQIPDDLMW
ncbi:DUF2058 domain-containing protein [Rheinheimera sp.]|uniref:DUF2058 domain-containing protein n=1 Tax=Rheinheimera sp. TaxID=1869214 RepID=UPI00307DD1B0